MAIFQNTVVNKYLNNQNEHVLSEKWNIYKTHFFDPKVQENIRDSKEEEYQEGFMRDLFVNVLGYTLKPKDNYNLVLEKKNVKDSKKADAAIAIDNKIFGVIELKGTYVTDFTNVETQAFGYKNNHTKDCIYVITSNFEKLRFYIDNTIDHIEFNLFTLTEQEFKLLYLCLAFENVKNQIPKKLKEGSLSQEEEITKQLYKDYSLFKRELFQDLTKQNPQFEPLELFKKSQKLLDRFLFLFFAEDRNLLPPNSVRLILTQWKQLKDLDAYSPLYERFKKYFGYLNTGFKGKQYDIFAYNGGLFKPDEVLANILIDDELLYKHTLKLADYDFVSEVDVNILGHIFENSLNELDNVKAQLEGTAIDKSTTKRKKDGIFYTPKYITKYIVENTVGKLCHEKKTALSIIEADYFTDKKRQKKTIKPLVEKLKQYRDWLLQLTICDPACGSGAFLNEALNFLIAEHGYVDELQAKLFGDAMVLSDVENSILENNLFGVDLNEESVEIAKLSLWLRTAQPNRKLNNLNNNIKCGNSLIDDPEIAGDKAFNWEQEFPKVFEKGGFDVVIGNPPYVDNRGFDKVELDYLYGSYTNSFEKSGTGKYKTTKLNLIAPFIELNRSILKEEGLLSYIFHKNIFKTNSYSAIRKYILYNYNILSLTDWGANQFADVVAETATFTLKKTHNIDDKISVNFYNLSEKYKENVQFQTEFKNAYEYIFGINLSNDDRDLIKKISEKSERLEYFVNINNGIVTGNDKKFIRNENLDGSFKKVIRGKNIKRYNNLISDEYIDYQKGDLLRARDERIFLSKEKLLMQMINIVFVITYDENQFYNLGTTYAITLKEGVNLNLKYLLVLLNSKLISFYYLKKFTNESSLTNAISTKNLFEIPMKIKFDQISFIEKADKMLSLNKDLQESSSKFQRTLQRQFEVLEKLPKKLENWYELTFADFLKELKKKKIVLSFEEDEKWEDYFLPQQQKALEIKDQITKTDKEIDAMVYELYGLTDKEIAIVENT